MGVLERGTPEKYWWPEVTPTYRKLIRWCVLPSSRHDVWDSTHVQFRSCRHLLFLPSYIGLFSTMTSLKNGGSKVCIMYYVSTIKTALILCRMLAPGRLNCFSCKLMLSSCTNKPAIIFCKNAKVAKDLQSHLHPLFSVDRQCLRSRDRLVIAGWYPQKHVAPSIQTL